MDVTIISDTDGDTNNSSFGRCQVVNTTKAHLIWRLKGGTG